MVASTSSAAIVVAWDRRRESGASFRDVETVRRYQPRSAVRMLAEPVRSRTGQVNPARLRKRLMRSHSGRLTKHRPRGQVSRHQLAFPVICPARLSRANPNRRDMP